MYIYENGIKSDKPLCILFTSEVQLDSIIVSFDYFDLFECKLQHEMYYSVFTLIIIPF